MKILIAADGSEYTKRILAYIAAHDDWLGTDHDYTVLHCVLAISHRAAAFVDKDGVRAFYAADAEAVFKPFWCDRFNGRLLFDHVYGWYGSGAGLRPEMLGDRLLPPS